MTMMLERGNYPERVDNRPRYNKQEVLNTLGRLSLPPEEYFVIGGANLVMRDIVDLTVDIDMLVSQRVFNNLRRRKGAILKSPPLRAREQGATNPTVWIENRRLVVPVSATTSLGDGYYPMSFDSHKDSTEMVEGFPCDLLESVIKSKEAVQRPRDIEHLKRISETRGYSFSPVLPLVENPFYIS